MSNKIIVPTLGESISEATVSKWLKSQGEKVSADEPIVELETDKVNVEVPSPSNGILERISVKEGETVNVGSLLGTILGSSTKTQNNIKELKNYSPPEKKKETEEKPQVFNEEKITKSKKSKKEKRALSMNEEPLILEQVHDEKIIEVKNTTIEVEKKVSPAARKIALIIKVYFQEMKSDNFYLLNIL